MSNHYGPEGVAPDDIRCMATAKGTGTKTYWEWTRKDHQCPRPAQQCREGIAVCYIHARTAKLVPWKGAINGQT